MLIPDAVQHYVLTCGAVQHQIPICNNQSCQGYLHSWLMAHYCLLLLLLLVPHYCLLLLLLLATGGAAFAAMRQYEAKRAREGYHDHATARCDQQCTALCDVLARSRHGAR